MTCIAWDGKTIAADSLITCEATGDYLTTKLHRIRGALYGWAGDGNLAATLLGWVRAGGKPADFPALDEDERAACTLLRITKAGAALLDGYPCWVTVDGQRMAIGSGAHFARAAMDFGKTAEQAVEYAATRVHSVGGPIKTMRLIA
jgi:hypothetical protein